MLDGRDLLAIPDAEMRDVRGRRMAMAFQDPMSAMNPSMTVGAQVAEPLERHLGLKRREAWARAVALCSETQIPDVPHRLSQFPHQFSGGMRQRAMIAMALSCRPRLLIADEPTTALDVTVQAQILQLLKRLVRKTQCAMMLITHDLGLVAQYADRVGVMYAGRIVESGPVRQLFKAPAHPYTRGLLASIPRLDRNVSERLNAIKGQPPTPGLLPHGCVFNPRCDFAIPRCRLERPELADVGSEQRRACFVELPQFA
ncbi:ABC transporter ATP-binding protein [Bradyrhizobium sp. 23AC]